MPTNKRVTWSSKLIYIITIAGATIGFGATWRFPYLVGQNGGGAYLLIFLIAMILLGIPMLIAEHIIGRRLQTNTVNAFGGNDSNGKPIAKIWKGIGFLAIIGAFGILAYYMVLGGWVTSYIAGLITGQIDLSSKIDEATVSDFFTNSISNPYKISLYTFVFVAINYYILVKGIIKGIEQLMRYIMPLFFGIVLLMVIRALTLPGAMEGVMFYIMPDFSKITGKVILEALGQVFFALSIGFGVMITLSSYLNKKEDIISISITSGILNIIVPFAMGLIIFPALFSVGIAPESGPSLVFKVLPVVFSHLWFGSFFGILFFVLLLMAALTTSITIYEVIITTLVEKTKMSRRFATLLTLTTIFIFGNIPCILSDSVWSNITIFGRSIFEAFDYISANIFFITTSFLSCIFICFILGKKLTIKEITNDGEINNKMAPILYYYLKFCIPLIILFLFYISVLQ